MYDPIYDRPLALCDGSTISREDLVLCDHVTQRYVAETTYLLRNPQQKWYYLDQQRPDEVLLFKNFDSDESVKAQCTYHSSPKSDSTNRFNRRAPYFIYAS